MNKSNNSFRRGAVRWAAAALTCGSAAIAVAVPADAAPISDASLSWGVKASFRSYILGPIANGSITTGDGATIEPDGAIAFVPEQGDYEPGSGGAVAFSGSVRFTGHGGQLDLTMSHPRIEIDDEHATLILDVVSRSFGDTDFTTFDDVVMAEVDLGTPLSDDAGARSWRAASVVLTQAGSLAFSEFYSAGAPLDPFDLAVEWPVAPATSTTLDPATTSTVAPTTSTDAPTTTDVATGGSSTTDSPSSSVAAVDDGGSTTSVAADIGTLPTTGAPIVGLVVGGSVLLAGGSGMLLVRRMLV